LIALLFKSKLLFDSDAYFFDIAGQQTKQTQKHTL